MMRPYRHRRLLFGAALAALALRALTPDGYMPGSAGSGLLYELCPNGMPPAVMAVLRAAGAHHHHHHHGDADDEAGVTGTEQCPIGHMLSSVFAVDVDSQDVVLSDLPPLFEAPRVGTPQSRVIEYRSRAPPA